MAVSLAALTLPAAAETATQPHLLCTVAPQSAADVRPDALARACAELARLLGTEALATTPAGPVDPSDRLMVVLHLTQADGRRLAGWIDWADHRPGAPRAAGAGRPAAAMLPDRSANSPFPELLLTRFLTLSLREADVPS